MLENRAGNIHQSVLLKETVEILRPEYAKVIVDATLGLGGHSESLLDSSEGIQVIGIDQDAKAISLAAERLKRFGDRFVPIHANFSEIQASLTGIGMTSVDAVLADLGISSFQLDSPDRGFSFRFDAPLDMRMDTSKGE